MTGPRVCAAREAAKGHGETTRGTAVWVSLGGEGHCGTGERPEAKQQVAMEVREVDGWSSGNSRGRVLAGRKWGAFGVRGRWTWLSGTGLVTEETYSPICQLAIPNKPQPGEPSAERPDHLQCALSPDILRTLSRIV